MKVVALRESQIATAPVPAPAPAWASRAAVRGALFVLLLAVLPGLAGCTTAPATGRTIFTGGLSQEKELALGAEEHPKITKSFGGTYDDPALQAYVSSVGRLLAKTSELPDLEFTFTVLDTPIVNAFAVPGGYVYVTRGLVALAGDEAELAGVLAHEIGHITARHSAERYGQAMAAQAAQLGLGLLLGGQAAQLGGALAGPLLSSYSREQESEADGLGVRYLSRVGYDPRAMSSFLERLLAHSRLEAELAGRPGAADEFDIMQTHPRTSERVDQALREAGVKQVADPMRGRDIFLSKVDGVVYGDSADQGFVRGRSFVHPKLRFAFTVPEEFRLSNTPKQVIARGPDGALILFDQADKASGATMAGYLTREWGRQLDLKEVETLNVNGMEAATGHARVSTAKGRFDLRLLAIRYDAEHIYRLLFVTSPAHTESLSRALRETTYSFRRLSEAEAAEAKPWRIALHRVRAGESLAEIARRQPFAEASEARLRVLNGLGPNDSPEPGQLIKVVTE